MVEERSMHVYKRPGGIRVTDVCVHVYVCVMTGLKRTRRACEVHLTLSLVCTRGLSLASNHDPK